MQELIRNPNVKYGVGAVIALLVLLTFFNVIPFYVGMPLALMVGLGLAKLLGVTVDVMHDPEAEVPPANSDDGGGDSN